MGDIGDYWRNQPQRFARWITPEVQQELDAMKRQKLDEINASNEHKTKGEKTNPLHSELEKQLARARLDLFQRRAENEVNYRPPSHMHTIDFQRLELEEDMRLPVFWNWLLAVVFGVALGGFVLLMLWVLF
jgi:hypothetical protein